MMLHMKHAKGVFIVLAVLIWGVALLSFEPVHGQGEGYKVWLPIAQKDNSNPVHQGEATYYFATGAGRQNHRSDTIEGGGPYLSPFAC